MDCCVSENLRRAWSQQERLAALRDYAILDTEPEVAFNDIARIAAEICNAPMAMVSFVEDTRQWFKSEIGLGICETPIDASICAHAIKQDDLFIVPDTTKDPRFAENSLVTGNARVRFYAGAVLKNSNGLPLGTVCVLGNEPRPDGLTNVQADILRALARSVMRELELRVANRALSDSEERLRLALQAGRMFAWERNLSDDFVTRSGSALDLIGLGSGPASEFDDRVHLDDKWRAPMWGSCDQQEEIRYVRPDGEIVWLSARSIAVSEEGKPRRLIGVTFDITDRKRAEQELWWMANHDALTGLVNRVLFQQRLAAAIESAGASGASVSLLLLDLDDFKSVNDTLGHDAGDALLVEAAKRLSAKARDIDTVARLGGDEFALILLDTDLDEASRFAQELAEAMSHVIHYAGRAISTKASMGIAGFPAHHGSPIELMKDADIALYRAKAERRGRAVVYTEAARERIEQRVRVLAEVRDGLSADQFRPFYQPQVSLRTGEIVGLEALARWQHPSRGILAPGSFGPAFSDPETTVAMGARMIRHVLGDVRGWLDQGIDCGRVAVNFSSTEFGDPHLAEHILGLLAEFSVPTYKFEVEVTESVFLERSTETALDILRQFARAGVTVALDDFGTGFASLTHLKRFPVHHVKIDQSFIRDLETDREDAAIVSAVINLGQSMGMEVTAEGVETAGQAARLKAMGCDQAQGYFYAKPMIATRVPWLISNWSQPMTASINGPNRITNKTECDQQIRVSS